MPHPLSGGVANRLPLCSAKDIIKQQFGIVNIRRRIDGDGARQGRGCAAQWKVESGKWKVESEEVLGGTRRWRKIAPRADRGVGPYRGRQGRMGAL